MFCYKCGMKIDDRDVYCKRCGANQKQRTAPNQVNQNTISNKLLKLLACYFVGKEANKKIKSLGIGIPTHNPNTDRYMKTVNKARKESRKKYNK